LFYITFFGFFSDELVGRYGTGIFGIKVFFRYLPCAANPAEGYGKTGSLYFNIPELVGLIVRVNKISHRYTLM
jgi:hypothetical protein